MVRRDSNNSLVLFPYSDYCTRSTSSAGGMEARWFPLPMHSRGLGWPVCVGSIAIWCKYLFLLFFFLVNCFFVFSFSSSIIHRLSCFSYISFRSSIFSIFYIHHLPSSSSFFVSLIGRPIRGISIHFALAKFQRSFRNVYFALFKDFVLLSFLAVFFFSLLSLFSRLSSHPRFCSSISILLQFPLLRIVDICTSYLPVQRFDDVALCFSRLRFRVSYSPPATLHI